jgi:hypothetical protein
MAYGTVAVFGHAIVRCQEADGSMNFEWRGADCCVPRPATNPGSSAPTVASTGDIDDCGNCRDQGIAVDVATRAASVLHTARTQVPDAPLALPALPVDARASFGLTWSACPSQVRAPIPPPPLAAIRTVVLRC